MSDPIDVKCRQCGHVLCRAANEEIYKQITSRVFGCWECGNSYAYTEPVQFQEHVWGPEWGQHVIKETFPIKDLDELRSFLIGDGEKLWTPDETEGEAKQPRGQYIEVTGRPGGYDCHQPGDYDPAKWLVEEFGAERHDNLGLSYFSIWGKDDERVVMYCSDGTWEVCCLSTAQQLTRDDVRRLCWIFGVKTRK